jgi:hypothetical protein
VPDESSATGAGSEAGPVPIDSAAADRVAAERPPPAAPVARTIWPLYVAGMALQTILWFLLFLAIVVAVATGGHLTEFRYVGF